MILYIRIGADEPGRHVAGPRSTGDDEAADS